MLWARTERVSVGLLPGAQKDLAELTSNDAEGGTVGAKGRLEAKRNLCGFFRHFAFSHTETEGKWRREESGAYEHGRMLSNFTFHRVVNESLVRLSKTGASARRLQLTGRCNSPQRQPCKR